MAEKYSLIEPGISKPVSIRKSIAFLMLRRQQADLVGHRTIRRRPHGSATLKADMPKPDPTPRAAGTLPPREVEGTFFQRPKSDSWILAHQSVDFTIFPFVQSPVSEG